MSFTLGNITLPRPQGFERRQVETSKTHRTVSGKTTKDITNRKEQYILSYEHLTQSEITDILGEWDLETTRTFQVSETNLSIGPTEVHIEIGTRKYLTPGGDYREDIVLVLTEVE